MAHTLTQTAEEFEKVFPEAAILLRMQLQSVLDCHKIDTATSEVEELRAQNAELRAKLSRPKGGSRGPYKVEGRSVVPVTAPKRTVL